MVHFIVKYLSTYGYTSIRDLFESMFPSWKYELQALSLLLSTLSAGLSYLFGFGPALAIAMLVAVLAEINTGIRASKKQGKDFETFRFSRCILKLGIWALIFYIIHAFENEFVDRSHPFDIIIYLFFKLVFLGALSMFLVEHIASILENKAILEDKPKTYFIEFIQDTWKNVLSTIKNKIQ